MHSTSDLSKMLSLHMSLFVGKFQFCGIEMVLHVLNSTLITYFLL